MWLRKSRVRELVTSDMAENPAMQLPQRAAPSRAVAVKSGGSARCERGGDGTLRHLGKGLWRGRRGDVHLDPPDGYPRPVPLDQDVCGLSGRDLWRVRARCPFRGRLGDVVG
jgi:hypothetical protein